MPAKGDADSILQLHKKYKLHPTDAYIHSQKNYKVINRRGCKKIQAQEKIHMKFILDYTDGSHNCVVRAIGSKFGDPQYQNRETYGECSPRNSNFIYPHSVAQSRAEGRLILELAGLYEKGFITEDEIDEKFLVDKVVKEREETAKGSIDATLKAMNLDKKK